MPPKAKPEDSVLSGVLSDKERDVLAMAWAHFNENGPEVSKVSKVPDLFPFYFPLSFHFPCLMISPCHLSYLLTRSLVIVHHRSITNPSPKP